MNSQKIVLAKSINFNHQLTITHHCHQFYQ